MPALADNQHERFALAYAGHRNSAKAAVEAGVPVHLAQDLLANRSIRGRVRELWGAAMENAGAGPERVIQELARIAFSSIRDLYDPTTGRLLAPHELNDDVAATITGIEVETRWEKGEDGEAKPITTTKYKRADKAPAYTILAKHFKVVGDEGQAQSALATVLADALQAGRQRAYAAAREQAEDVTPRGPHQHHVLPGEAPLTGERLLPPPEFVPTRVVESDPLAKPREQRIAVVDSRAASATLAPEVPSAPHERYDDLA